MSGIAGHVKPPGTPPYADCSSFATWVFYAAGVKDPNGGHYSASQVAYTGTLWSRGRKPTGAPKPGDLVFFGNPRGSVAHVAIYIAGGKCISLGSGVGPIVTTIAAEAGYKSRGTYGYRTYSFSR